MQQHRVLNCPPPKRTPSSHMAKTLTHPKDNTDPRGPLAIVCHHSHRCPATLLPPRLEYCGKHTLADCLLAQQQRQPGRQVRVGFVQGEGGGPFHPLQAHPNHKFICAFPPVRVCFSLFPRFFFEEKVPVNTCCKRPQNHMGQDMFLFVPGAL